jgi:hypothetical protein
VLFGGKTKIVIHALRNRIPFKKDEEYFFLPILFLNVVLKI